MNEIRRLKELDQKLKGQNKELRELIKLKIRQKDDILNSPLKK